MKNSEGKKAKTKQLIMDSFWDIYCEKRIEEITVKEVTIRAGLNRSTFYEYFIDIYDVLEQIELSLIPDIDSLPPFKIESQSLGMPLDMFMKMYESQGKYFSVLFGENGDPSFIRKIKDSVKSTIFKTIDSKTDDLEFDFVVEYTLSAMIGIMQYWFSQDKKIPADKLIELTGNLMDKGVSSYLFNQEI